MTTPCLTSRNAFLVILLSVVCAGAAYGQIPTTIAFQGLMTDDNGVPLPTGEYSLSFRIYNVETAGAAVWTEVQSAQVLDGVANASLGRINPLTLAFDAPYWLGITVGQNPTELKPRIQMNSVAYALNARDVVDDAITEAKLADGAVTRDKMADDSINETKIADNAIPSAKIQTGAVTPDKINIEGATSGQTLVFRSGELVWGAPSGEGVISEVEAGNGLEGGGTDGKVTLDIADEGIVSAMIRPLAVQTDHIAKNAVTTDQIANEAVTVNKIPVGELALNRLSIAGADPDEFITFNGTIPVWKAFALADGSVGTRAIADEAVSATKIFVTGADPNDVLTYNGTRIVWAAPGGIGAGSVGTTELENGAVTEIKLADGAVSSVKLANGAVTDVKLNDGSVISAKLANDAVTTVKVADGAITGAKLDNGAVDAPQLAAGAITTSKIAAAAVSLPKIDVTAGSDSQVLTISGGAAVWAPATGVGPGSVGETELADNAVSEGKIQTAAVTAGKIGSQAVGNAALADGAVNNIKIAPASIDPLNKFDVTGASDGQFLVYSGGALTWTNTVTGNLNVTGDFDVTGNLSKGAGTFKIDHPLDPTNKYLYHSFVESDDMMNIYAGNVELDADGRAVVTLPDWFQPANKDFRYQLTCIGGYAPVFIEKEIENGEFVIAGGNAALRVSWQITAVRDDAFARMNRVQVEVDKPTSERGTYLHPVPSK